MAVRKILNSKKRRSQTRKKMSLWDGVVESVKSLIRFLLLVIFVLPVGYIFSLNFMDPVITPLMMQRTMQGYKHRFEWVHAPKIMRYAVVASEDNNFCSHHGFDFSALKNAISATLKGQKSTGASTISMQTSKNLFLLPTRSYIRKGLEAYYTIWLELLLDKPRIMQIYLNIIEFGRGVYGVEAASQYYFKQSASQLTRQQASQLAAILPRPLHWSPKGKIAKSKQITKRTQRLGHLLSCVQ